MLIQKTHFTCSASANDTAAGDELRSAVRRQRWSHVRRLRQSTAAVTEWQYAHVRASARLLVAIPRARGKSGLVNMEQFSFRTAAAEDQAVCSLFQR